jgi:hypothetical protein
MTRDWINAQLGFTAGSVGYFSFLTWASCSEHFRPKFNNGEVVCGVRTPFWYDIVSEANLDPDVQPNLLYLAALLGAALLFLLHWPVRQEPPAGTRSPFLSAWVFGPAVVLNFWFSASNLAPRMVPW